MKKTILCLLSFASLICADPISEKSNSFASDFYQQTLSTENVCFSPYSLFSCLSTAYLGARGPSEQELAKLLYIDISQQDFADLFSSLDKRLQSDQLNSANAIWLGKDVSLLDSYKDMVKDLNVEVRSLDFSKPSASASIINSWVAQKTKNNIPSILSPGDLKPSTRAVLTNAIHFQSTWMKSFSEKLTAPKDFYINDNESTIVQMMKQKNRFDYYEDETYQLLLLPVKSSQSSYSCFFLLPKAFLGSLEDTFSVDTLLDQIHKARDTLLTVEIPKFTVETSLDAKSVLQKIGVANSFSPNANFSGLTNVKNLCIEKILHKAFFSITETGVTASAATGITMGVTCCRPKDEPIYFVADHPFIFGIVDLNADLVLFLGKLNRP